MSGKNPAFQGLAPAQRGHRDIAALRLKFEPRFLSVEKFVGSADVHMMFELKACMEKAAITTGRGSRNPRGWE